MAYMNQGKDELYDVFFEISKGIYSRIVYSPKTGRLRVLNSGIIAAEIPAGILKQSYDLEGTFGSDDITVKGNNGKQGILHYSSIKTILKNMPKETKAGAKEPIGVLEQLVKAAEPLVSGFSSSIII